MYLAPICRKGKLVLPPYATKKKDKAPAKS